MGLRGPKTKLTPELIKKAAGIVAVGTPYRWAAAHIGVTEQCFEQWREKGAAEKSGIYRDFFDAIETANSNCIIGCLATIRQGRMGWQGSAWILERRFKNEFGRHLVLEQHMTKDEQEIEEVMVEFRKSIKPSYQPRNGASTGK